jgi:hypothetical protein
MMFVANINGAKYGESSGIMDLNHKHKVIYNPQSQQGCFIDCLKWYISQQFIDNMVKDYPQLNQPVHNLQHI